MKLLDQQKLQFAVNPTWKVVASCTSCCKVIMKCKKKFKEILLHQGTDPCCSLDRSNLPDTSCCRDGHTRSVQRSRPAADKTYYIQSRSSAHYSWDGPESGTEPQDRGAGRPATGDRGWSSLSERLSLSAHLETPGFQVRHRTLLFSCSAEVVFTHRWYS